MNKVNAACDLHRQCTAKMPSLVHTGLLYREHPPWRPCQPTASPHPVEPGINMPCEEVSYAPIPNTKHFIVSALQRFPLLFTHVYFSKSIYLGALVDQHLHHIQWGLVNTSIVKKCLFVLYESFDAAHARVRARSVKAYREYSANHYTPSLT